MIHTMTQTKIDQLPQIWGHRGAMDFAPMNTLAAFREALAQGADGVELDVHLSADGQVMVIHDDTVNATSNGQGKVAELSLEQLQALDAGAWFAPQFSGEHIPTLLEVFETLPAGTTVNVEIKTTYAMKMTDIQALAGLTVDVVRTCARGAKVIFSSFDPRAIRTLTRLAPEIRRALLVDKNRPWWMALLSLGLVTQAIHPHFSLVDQTLVAKAHARGQAVHAWTANEIGDARRLAELGVDALISNRPGEIRQALQA